MTSEMVVASEALWTLSPIKLTITDENYLTSP